MTTTRTTRPLTRRETEILQLKAQGMTSQAVADRLFVSVRTVDFHLTNIYTKLDARNLIEAMNAVKGITAGRDLDGKEAER